MSHLSRREVLRPAGVVGGPDWQRPRRPSADAVDVVEVAAVEGGVLFRTSLGATVAVSALAWADFIAAVTAGEYDCTDTCRRERSCTT